MRGRHVRNSPDRACALRARQSGFAVTAVLVLLTFVSAMILAAVRRNFAQLRHVRMRRDAAIALCAAESGAHHAVRGLAKGAPKGQAQGRTGKGRYRAEWRPVAGKPGVYEVISTGTVEPCDARSPRRTVRVTVETRGGGAAPRCSGWCFE